MLTDAHCHFEGKTDLAVFQQREKMYALVNCQNPAEWEFNHQLVAGNPRQILSFGIHPWDSATLTLDEVAAYLARTNIVGEIGLDNVWPDVPLEQQRPIFLAQLEFAQNTHKPVVLHTKGCEQEILQWLKKYPNRYLIHWYSDASWQQEFIDLGCYFTIGVDVAQNPAVEQLARSVPLDHLLIESDGLSAIEWAQNRPITLADYPAVLEESLKLISSWRNTTPEKLAAQIAENFLAFTADN